MSRRTRHYRKRMGAKVEDTISNISGHHANGASRFTAANKMIEELNAKGANIKITPRSLPIKYGKAIRIAQSLHRVKS